MRGCGPETASMASNSLDRAAFSRMLCGMHPRARPLLHVLMLVVAFSVAGLNGYASALACHAGASHALDTSRTHGPHGSASHDAGVSAERDAALSHAHANPDGHVGAHGMNVPDADGDAPCKGDPGCKHVHVHCCATFAMAPAECGLVMASYARSRAPIADAHIPAGQLASPLFRPPRHTA